MPVEHVMTLAAPDVQPVWSLVLLFAVMLVWAAIDLWHRWRK
jgi:hypothetical protein